MWQTILAVIKAIPTIKSWVEQLVTLYLRHQLAQMRKADLEAIRKAIHEHDQRELEKQIGNPKPGEPSNTPGADIRDDLPNVSDQLPPNP